MALNRSQIILASASPRRAELLDQIGIRYRVQAVDIDESRQPNESAEFMVQRLASEKSQAVANNSSKLFSPNSNSITDFPVLGADTLGVLNGELLVKPKNFEHAHAMLSSMSGNWHEILSAIALSYNGQTRVKLNRNRVLFRQISSEEIEAYWQTGEPQDKAGAYAIQGLAAAFIERIEGSYSGIMGLPLFETSQLLEEIGINIIKT
jgi:septum formation protein